MRKFIVCFLLFGSTSFAAETFELDFSVDTPPTFDGTDITVTAGVARQDAAGLAMHPTAVTGDEKWVRVIHDNAMGLASGIAISDASGNGFIVFISEPSSYYEVNYLVEYDTYTTYAANDDARSNTFGVQVSNSQLGFTFDLPNTTVRIWDTVTADEPTAVDSWDGGGPDETIDYGALGQTQDGDYIGFGTWSSPTVDYRLLAAGPIGSVSSDTSLRRRRSN